MAKNIIIDTDPGVDDAFALIYAMKNREFNILGITTVSGNNNIDQVTENALKLVKYCGKEIGVYEGEGEPYAREKDQGDNCHGDDGLGGAGLGLDFGRKEDQHGVDFILEMARSQEDLTLVTLGPLTNIARAIEKDQEAMARVDKIVSMGGGIDQGNVTDYAEFNYWADPEAAKIVFDSGLDIVMVGLNATNYSFFSRDEFEFMKSLGRKEGELLYKMQGVYSEHYKKTFGIDGCRIHDLLAMVLASNEKVARGRRGYIDIALDQKYRGETRPNYNRKGNVDIIEEVDEKLYKDEFFMKVFEKDIGSYKEFSQD